MPYLIQDFDTLMETVFELGMGSNMLGRGSKNHIILEDRTKSVSRQHAEIIVAPEQVVIVDLGSRNHTFVNGAQIERQQLHDGDIVQLGNLPLRFVRSTAEAVAQEKLEHLAHLDDHDLDHQSTRGVVEEDQEEMQIVKQMPTVMNQTVMQDLLRSDLSSRGSVLKIRNEDSNQRAVDKLQILLEVSKLLSRGRNESLDSLLEKILDLLFEIMDIDRSAILLINEHTGELESRAVRAREGVEVEQRFYSQKIANFVRDRGDALLTSNAGHDKRFNASQSILQSSIRAAMCVPLRPVDQVIGVLYVDNLSLYNAYTDEDLEFLSALANQAALAIDNFQLNRKMQQEALMRSKLEGFFPQAVSRKLQEEGGLQTIETEVTALFCDISGFTKLSSRLPPREIIEMLNEYFQVMVEDIVFHYEGTLENYLGDGLFAVWGAPYRKPDDVVRAIWAAIEMQLALFKLNQQWQIQGRDLKLQIHIGLNTGQVAAGNIGSEKIDSIRHDR
jgi:adenylate cyclase